MKYLGIDFGLKRIGLASSEGNLSSPLKVLKVKSLKDSLEQIEEIVKKEEFDKLVVGLPEGKISKMVNGFINGLRKKGLEVVETDETLSTQNALKQMVELNIPKEKRRVSDAYSASLILQDYLDSL